MRTPLILKLFILTILVATSFSLRFYYTNNTLVDTPIRADARDYYSYAVNIKEHGVYSRSWPSIEAPKPDALRSPGYPFFISKIVSYPPTKSLVWRISFWQSILDTLTVLLTYFLANQFYKPKVAFFAALLVAVSPHLISATSYVLTETLFCFLMTASLLSVVTAIKKESKALFLLAGILLALASLTRPTIQYFLVPLVFGLFFASNKLAVSKGAPLIVILGFLMFYTPWVVRNIQVLGVSSDSTLTVNTLHHGIYPNFMYQSMPQTKGIPYRYDARSKEISKNVNSAINEIIRRFEEEPIRHLKWYLIDKPIAFFSWNIVAGFGDVFIYPVLKTPYFDNPFYKKTHLVMYWLHWPLVILSVCAGFMVWLPIGVLAVPPHEQVAIRILSLLMLYFIAVHIVGAPFPRYSIPLRPITYILAIWPILFVIKKLKKKGAE